MNDFSELAALDGEALAYTEHLFGGLVPATEALHTRLMHRLDMPSHKLELWRVSLGEPAWLHWTLHVALPHHAPQPSVLLSPDGCWPQVLSDGAIRATLNAGLALAWFNRLELAEDAPDAQRRGPVFGRWPERGFGALAAWAWGLHRCVDALLLTGHFQAGRIGVVGHSRGGKAALLAGASDARIGATVSHNSGTGGAASLQCVGAGSESLQALAARFPHWLGIDAVQADTQQRIVSLDSLALLRAIAPRGLCLLQAEDDLWANPEGTRHNARQLRPVWEALNASDRLEYLPRSGGHAMTEPDWQNAARFVARVLQPSPSNWAKP